MSTPIAPNSTITFEPKGLLTGRKDDTYILNHEDILKLLKYVWGGVLLPTDRKAYVDRLNVTEESLKTLGPLIDKLIPSLTAIHGDCKKFKDDTYPSIVSLASDVKDYAFKAGGNGVVENSYYANIQNLIDAAAKETDAQKAASGKKDVDELIDVMVKDIKALVDKATQKRKDLQAFEEHCKTDQTNLKLSADAIKKELTSTIGDISKVDEQIKKARDELKRLQQEYELDCIIAGVAPIYVWCPVVGLIAAITVASVYGSKAVAAQKAINDLKAAIEAGDKQIKADKIAKIFIGDLGLFQSNLDSLQTTAADAVKTFEKVIGILNGIADELESLRNITKTDIREAQGIVQKIDIKTVCAHWKTLQDAAERYRTVAFISAPEEITLDQAVKELSKYISPEY